MKTKKIVRLLLALAAMPILAQAQSAGVGGGSFTEPEMKGFMNILSDYFATKDYSDLFPEVVQWEKQNNLRMAQFIRTIQPRVVDHPLYFPAGVERDCVSYEEDYPAIRWFECNSARIPESNLENQPKLYALLAHEIFVQAGIEKAGDSKVPSTYESSSKFLDKKNLSLETIQRYVPGATKNPDGTTTTMNPTLKFARQQLLKTTNSFSRSLQFKNCFSVRHVVGDSYGKYVWKAHHAAGDVYIDVLNPNVILLNEVIRYGRNQDIRNVLDFSKSDLKYYSSENGSNLVFNEDGSLIVEILNDNPAPGQGIPSVRNNGKLAVEYYFCRAN